MKFTFIGDGDDPSEVTVYGYTFQLGGSAVEVENEKAIAKLSGNPCFAKGEAPAVAPVQRERGRPAKASLPPKMEQVSESELGPE